eukprot:3106296-Rhodomonas_salina.1
MSLEELFHQRMAHVPILKLAKMSHLVDCLPCHLHFPKALRVSVLCVMKQRQSVSLFQMLQTKYAKTSMI